MPVEPENPRPVSLLMIVASVSGSGDISFRFRIRFWQTLDKFAQNPRDFITHVVEILGGLVSSRAQFDNTKRPKERVHPLDSDTGVQIGDIYFSVIGVVGIDPHSLVLINNGGLEQKTVTDLINRLDKNFTWFGCYSDRQLERELSPRIDNSDLPGIRVSYIDVGPADLGFLVTDVAVAGVMSALALLRDVFFWPSR